MNYLKKLLIAFLILTSINLCLPKVVLAGDTIFLSKSDITKNSPESSSTPEKDIPVETVETPEKSKGWLWVVVAILAVAGGVAIAGSSGGGSNNSGGVSVTWEVPGTENED